MEDTILSWKAREFIHYEKGIGWYLTLTILGILLISYEIILKDYFAALTLFVVYLSLYMYARIHPQEIEVLVTEKGIIVDETTIPYLAIKRFWIVHNEDVKALHLETNAYLNRYITLQLEDQDPYLVAEVLRNFINESEPNVEHMSNKIARILRF